MNDVTIASSEKDAHAAEAVVEHHAQMSGALAVKVEVLLASARRGEDVSAARDDLVAWGRGELLPHALAEEGTLYRAAGDNLRSRLLVEAMLAEHQVIGAVIDELATATDTVAAVGSAAVLRAIFDTHMSKENEQILPLLVADPAVSVADLLAGMHELLGGAAGHEHEQSAATAASSTAHDCTCGEKDGHGFPELDARAIPHAIRHSTVFGALDAVRPGKGLVLIAPHDPLPLLGQLERREPGVFTVDYLQRGPESWRLEIVRAG